MNKITVDPFDLPSLPLSAKAQLPGCPAIYFVLDGAMVLYIGQAVKLSQRWIAHHRFKQLQRVAVNPRIAWMEVGDLALLDEIEKALISYFSPKWNYKRAAGSAPFGYVIAPDNSALAPGPQWAVARTLVERYIAGEPIGALRNWLYVEHGIKRSGDGLSKWMQSPTIRGHLHYVKSGEIIPNNHPALISEAEYQTIKDRIDLNRRLRGANLGKVYPIPSGGLVRCAVCGFALLTSTTKGRRYFRCTQLDCNARQKYVRSDAIEAAIQEAIVESAAAISDAVANAEAAGDVVDPRVAQLEAEIKQLEPLAHRPAVALEIEYIQGELEQIKASTHSGAADAAGKMKMIQELGQLNSDGWAVLSVLERRDIYQYLVEAVIVDRHEILEVRLDALGC